MPPKTPMSSHGDLFRMLLENTIDQRHELVRLSRLINWAWFDEAFGAYYDDQKGREGLRGKFTGYHLYKREGIYKKFGDFEDFRVLVQTNSERRTRNIVKLAGEFERVVEVWAGYKVAVHSTNILTDRIWVIGNGRKKIVGGEVAQN